MERMGQGLANENKIIRKRKKERKEGRKKEKRTETLNSKC